MLLSEQADEDFRAGRRDKAAAAWLRVLEIEPDLARAHYALGLIYAEDDTAKARKHLERFIAISPGSPEAATARRLMDAR